MASAELSEAGLPACNNIVLNPPKKIKTNNASNENTFYFNIILSFNICSQFFYINVDEKYNLFFLLILISR